MKSFRIACSSAFVLDRKIVSNTIKVAKIPPKIMAKPLYNASSGAIGKLIGRLNVTMKNVDDGPAIFKAVKM
ncbi:hypothetical protein JMUB1273_2421 [Staphylococcus aureus]|nr:hypothetical protein JMUB1273_2421 [Staphylococcus aureus]